ncbi:MAG TPA: hypothetical protein VNI84_09675 [Pyrinomonadaceae bacterium]|nr:hypothetical protein [Pyrinomonadaceae bacterium]
MKGKPDAAVYQLKKEVLGEFERMSRNGLINLYYGDESGINLDATSAVWLAILG